MNRPAASSRRTRLATQALGLVFLLCLALFGWFAIAVYNKTFSDAETVILRADRVGNQLGPNADVKVRGMVVGSVREVRVSGERTEIELAIEPDKIGQLPSNVTARLLPKSVFGQKFVNLIIPDEPDPLPLSAGAVIEQDDSRVAIELERLLNDLMPLLQAVQPQKLAASLGSAAQALDGRGEQLGGTLVTLNSYLNQLNPHLPRLQSDIAKFADVLEAWEAVGPDLIDALHELRTTSRTIAERRQDVHALLVTVAAASDELQGFLRPNSDVIDELAANSKPVLRLLAQNSGRFPCLFDAVNRLRPIVEKALGKGTGEPGLHVDLTTKRPRSGGTGKVGARC